MSRKTILMPKRDIETEVDYTKINLRVAGAAETDQVNKLSFVFHLIKFLRCLLISRRRRTRAHMQSHTRPSKVTCMI